MARPGVRGPVDMSAAVAAMRSSWALLSPRSRRRYAWVVVGQMATGVLDLVGVVILGLVGVTASIAAGGGAPASLAFLDLAGRDPLVAAGMLAVVAAAALILRALLYSLLLVATYRLLSRCQSEVTAGLLSGLLRRPPGVTTGQPSQSIAHALTAGAAAAVSGLMGSVSVILTDLTLVLLLGAGLLVVNPAVALVSAVYLGAVAVLVHGSLTRWSARVGNVIGSTGVSTMVGVQEAVGMQRELWALGRLGAAYARVAGGLDLANDARAKLTLIGQIPRVVYDTALVAGALAIGVWQLRTSSLAVALATLLIFLAAATRIIPSLLRVNGQLLQVRSFAGMAQSTYSLAGELSSPLPPEWQPPPLEGSSARRAGGHRGALAVRLDRVSYTYPSSTTPALRDVDLTVSPGALVAVVGPTGSGKSTLADAIVGIAVPQQGTVTIDGDTPLARILDDPGSIAYVPQRPLLVDGTVRDNVAAFLPVGSAYDDDVWRALRQAHIADVIEAMPLGLETALGEHGARLSGGQRQRIGLARALYSHPRLLILDEATSALDAETERAIADGLAELRGATTVVIIAHRLAAVREADVVVYLDEGRVGAAGRFADLVSALPAFARQVDLMSLAPDPA